jgi:hypothetical protein
MAFFLAQLDRFQRVLLGSVAAIVVIVILMRFSTFAALVYSHYAR